MNAETLWLLLTSEGIDISLEHCRFMVFQKNSTEAGVTVNPRMDCLVCSCRYGGDMLIDEAGRAQPLTDHRRDLWEKFAKRQRRVA